MTPSDQSDLSIAVAAAKAAFAAASAARDGPLRARAKSVSADLVTDADGRAEAAAVAVLQTHRPDDAVIGEEGSDHTGATARRWYVDGIDGTVAFASRIATWCSAVVIEDEQGPKATAVYDGTELHTASRGEGAFVNGERSSLRAAPTLQHAHVALFLRQDRLVKPGVRAVGHRLLDRTGLIRHAGPGSLELAWVAAGRLDGWIQPDTDPWDWLPGALLVTEAGGTAVTIQRETRWHVAGSTALVDELVALLT
ncbi:inositol monophosphatase [Solirubrobacter ginsenosidimutans]|uniref:Inositol monophosphatase n=1 Tax=Solirubrobacter ginsenosidimutans TaxID=490573 RepID=A0A9X3S7S8_9ACTN|nr:inositol monophosphatase [Solirubrobacter ginsenosidimutans]MDA0166306.1 inositol monophosphatase [Solirubrobacter ginsenosidimutans]